jgi:uncharacterized protein with NAD-binding domain and iron-sulfur cluster
MDRRKIAILGGGIGGLTTALRLTEDPAVRATLDITIYSLGHRLGGKCASGRSPADNGAFRIEEHGLHIFAGFYHHAFDMLKRCYAEVDGKGGVIGKDVFDAFRPQNRIVVIEHVDGRQIPWPVDFLGLPGLPGEGKAVPSVEELLAEIVQALWHHFVHGAGAPAHLPRRAPLSAAGNLGHHLRATVEHALSVLPHEHAARYVDHAAAEDSTEPDAEGAHGLHFAALIAQAFGRSGAGHAQPQAHHLPHLIELIEEFLKWVGTPGAGVEGDWLRRLSLGTNLVVAVLSGAHAGEVATRGFDHLDDMELKDWLRKHGAWEETVDWGPVAAGYDYTFGYGGGDPTRPSIGAGSALRGFLLGAMGEVVILPMYLTLQQRGVNFAFFHLAQELRLDADGQVGEIDLAVQAVPLGGAYDPLIDIGGGRRGWPSQPKWAGLVDGAQLQAAGVDFESAWRQPATMPTRTLRRGVEFDDVVVAMPTPVLRAISGGLSAANPDWKAMVEGLAVTRTVALQLWFTRDLQAQGWAHPDRVLTVSAQPFSSWCDMGFLIDSEGWPAADRPAGLAYYCGQLRDGPEPPHSDKGFPTQIQDAVEAAAKTWIAENAPLYMSAVKSSSSPLGIAPDVLFVPQSASVPDRLDWQYWRGNVSPWEMYQQAAPDTVFLRRRGDRSGFANVWLAGDWTLNGLNVGCVEAAVMSGLQCARAMLGDSSPLDGELDV